MPERAIVPTPKTFAELVTAVRAALITGQSRVDRAYLDTYRNAGQFIDAHLLLHQERAAYGAQVVPRLARSLSVDERLLYRCLKFVREYPILARGPELSWSHYRVLLDVSDKTRRKALEAAARQRRWTAPELERRVREANAINVTPTVNGNGASPAAKHLPLVPQRGTPGLHPIVERGEGLAVDLGFKLYWPLKQGLAGLRPYKAGDIVRIAEDDSLRRVDDATKAELFTYAATLRRVVDGDTLLVALEVSPGVWLEQKLRLRGLDCPEMSTPGGKAAKRFVDVLVAKATSVVINTTKPDKYDRYLADVFLLGVASDMGRVTSGRKKLGTESAQPAAELYLNNTLLENGPAVRKDAWEFGDWGDGGK